MKQAYENYSAEDQEVWKLLFNRQKENLALRACTEYNASLEKLEFFCFNVNVKYVKTNQKTLGSIFKLYAPLTIKIKSSLYELKSIILSGGGHATSILKCNDSNTWYYYDNELAKLRRPLYLRPTQIKILDGVNYLSEYPVMGPMEWSINDFKIGSKR